MAWEIILNQQNISSSTLFDTKVNQLPPKLSERFEVILYPLSYLNIERIKLENNTIELTPGLLEKKTKGRLFYRLSDCVYMNDFTDGFRKRFDNFEEIEDELKKLFHLTDFAVNQIHLFHIKSDVFQCCRCHKQYPLEEFREINANTSKAILRCPSKACPLQKEWDEIEIKILTPSEKIVQGIIERAKKEPEVSEDAISELVKIGLGL